MGSHIVAQANTTDNDDIKKSKTCDATSRLSVRLEQLRKSSDVGFIHFEDIMETMRDKEEALLEDLDADYVHNVQRRMTVPMREVLLEWLMDVQWDLGLMDETMFAGLNYIDVFLSKQPVQSKYLQLLGITAMMLASKTYEVRSQSVHEWLYLAKNQYSKKNVLALERKLLECLDWNIFQVTPFNFCKPWLKVLRIRDDDGVRFMFDFLIRVVYANTLCLELNVSRMTAVAIALSFVYLRRLDELDVALLCTMAKFDPLASDLLRDMNELFCLFVEAQRPLYCKEQGCDDKVQVSRIYAFFAGSEQRAHNKSGESGVVDVSEICFRREFDEYCNS